MLARGFTVEQMTELVHAGLATTNAERVVMGARTIEVARVRITEGRGGAHFAKDDAKQGLGSRGTDIWLALWVAVQGESAIMSNGLGSTAVAAILLLAAAPSVIHGGDYSVRADQSVRSVQRCAQASQLSPTGEPSIPAEHLGQESSLSAPPAPSVGNLPLNPHSDTPALVLDDHEVSAILGKGVRSNTGEEMGRIIDVIVGRDGRIHAAIIDFGGFLGIGTRKIAVDWNALDFAPVGKPAAIVLELTRNQVRLAPQYKRGEPLVVVGTTSAGARTARSREAAAPEK